MKIFFAGRRSFVAFAVLGLALTVFGTALAAPHSGGMQKSAGTGRPDNGQFLRVTVKLADKPVVGALVKVTVADGSVVASGLTKKNAPFSAALDAGIYTVTATSGKNSASSPVTIVVSATDAYLTLNLTPAP